jgi:hypothetical protein
MKTKAFIHDSKATDATSRASSCSAECLPNTSAVFSRSAFADCEDLLAAVRTTSLLAAISSSSLSVTVADEPKLCLEAGGQSLHETLDHLLSSIRTKLATMGSSVHESQFAFDVNLTTESFLSDESILLQVCLAGSRSPTSLVMR